MTSLEQVYTCIDHFCITNEPATLDPPQPGAHVLDIDYRLRYAHKLPRRTIRALDKRVHARLAEVVAKDKVTDPDKRIDAIRADDAGPTKEMWALFKDLNPRHLALIGGFEESCRFKPLLSMTKWNRLESLRLSGICTPECRFRLPPFVMRTLRSLTLDACLGLDFHAVGGAEPMLRLTNLGIHVNDVGYSCAMLLKNFPSIKKSLRCLSLDTLHFGYDTKRERTGIRRMLMECTTLTDVKLALLLHHSVGIAGFLPPSVQRVEFEGPCTMALFPLMDEWITCAKNPTWAPDLRYLEIKVDREHRRLPRPKEFFESKVREEEDAYNLSREEYIAGLPPGLTVIFGDEGLRNHAQFDYDAGDVVDMGFDPDTEPMTVPEDPFILDSGSEEDTDGEHEPEVDKIDLDNLPNIGPHPTHVIRQRSPSGATTADESKTPKKVEGVSDDAFAEFDRIFQAKKEEIFKILRSSRPCIELV